MAQRKGSKHAGYLPADQGRAPHIRADLASGGKTLPLRERGGVNRGIQQAGYRDRAGKSGGD